MNSGIYIIANTESDKFYIGSSVNLRKRWADHKSSLRGGQHRNSHLQHAWDKYGEVVFNFGVLEYLDDLKELIPAEQFWCDIYRGEGKELYNIALVGSAPMLGRHCSKEHRRKISEANKGKRRSKETRRKISMAHKGKILSEETKNKISKSMKGKGHPHSMKTRRKIGAAHAKPYPALRNQDTGEIIPAGVNLNALCRERNLNSKNLYEVVAGHRHHHKGWKLI